MTWTAWSAAFRAGLMLVSLSMRQIGHVVVVDESLWPVEIVRLS